MANVATLTVKKADGTTDIVYTALKGSGSDSDPALWEVANASVARIFRQVASFTSRWNARKTARNCELAVVIPETVVVAGETKLVGSVPVRISVVRPTNVSDAVVKEAVYQAANLFVLAAIKDQMVSGYAPT